MLKYVVEVKASNRSTAGFGKWGTPGRIWVRGYGDAKKPLYERTIGFVDLRYKGKRSYFYEVYREANRWAMYLDLLQQGNQSLPLNDFGRMCLDTHDLKSLQDKVINSVRAAVDVEEWGINKETWDTQVVYALVIMKLQQQPTEALH